MNKKGFTLIETIICVGLITMVAAVFVFNSGKMFGNKNKDSEDIKNEIISAAKIYAEGNKGIVEDLYNEKGFILLSIGQLIDNGYLDEGIKDENGNDIDRDTKVVVTLNVDGYLEYSYNENTTQGYLVAPELRISNKDTFSCDYMLNEELKFCDNEGNYKKEDGTIIYDMSSRLVSRAEDVTSNNEYSCEASKVVNGTPGEYKVKYTYQLEGVKKETTRKVVVLEDFKSKEIKKEDIETNISNEFYFNNNNKNYELIQNKNEASYNFKIKSNFDDYNMKLVYGIENNGQLKMQVQNEIKDLSVGNYSITIYSVKGEKKYEDSELIDNDTSELIEEELINFEIKDAPNLEILDISYTDEKDKLISKKSSWTTSKKIQEIKLLSDIPVKEYQYSINGVDWKKYNIGDTLNEVSKTIYIKVIDYFGRTSEKEFDYYVDKKLDSPYIISGNSATYQTSKTLKISLPKKGPSDTIYCYKLDDKSADVPRVNIWDSEGVIVTCSSGGVKFTEENLTINVSGRNNDRFDNIYLQTCNRAGCSDWRKENLYISKKVDDYINQNNGCISKNNDGCYYTGNQTKNYLEYGGNTWRIFQKDSSNQIHLILNNVYGTNKYYFSKYKMFGYCSNDWCCNGGAGFTEEGNSNPYLVTEISDSLNNLANNIEQYLTTNKQTSRHLDYSYKSTYDMINSIFNTSGGVSGLSSLQKYVTYTRKIGLMNVDELKNITSCNNYNTCSASYLDLSLSWGLATTVNYGTGTTYFGGVGTDYTRYKSPNPYYNFYTAAYSNKQINNIGGDVLVYVNQNSYKNYATEEDYDKKKEYNGSDAYLRPVMVLSSDAKITGGDGSSNSPYKIG